MGFTSRLRRLLARDRAERRRGEQDAPTDPANAGPREGNVGRGGADETGDVGPSGGERRTGEVEGRTGAARDE